MVIVMSDKQEQEKIKKDVIITGFGGQGIILAGSILGKAAALGDHLESTLVQSYGPESRGGACSAQVVLCTPAETESLDSTIMSLGARAFLLKPLEGRR